MSLFSMLSDNWYNPCITEDNIYYINWTTLPVTKLSNLESERIRRDCSEGERSVAVSKSSLFAV